MSVLKTTRGGKAVDYPLSNGAVNLGTGPGSQITLIDPAAAPRHCQVLKTDKGYVVRDTSGTPGTLVNGKKIQDHLLREGDVIQVGSERFAYSEQQASPSPAAPAKGASGAPAPKRTMNQARAASAASAAATRTAPAPARSHPPRRMSPKPGGTGKVHVQKDRSTFTLPSTTKGRVIALTAAIGLVAVLGVLYAFSSSQVDQEKLKADATAEILEWEKIPDTDPVRKYEEAARIAGNPDYVRYARGEIRALEKILPTLKASRDRQASAEREAGPFLGRFKKAKESKDEYAAQAERLYDEVKLLATNYAATSYETQLTEIRDELKKYLEDRASRNWINEIVKLTSDVQKDINGDDPAAGLAKVDQFGTEFDEKRTPDLKSRLDSLRSTLGREALSLVKKKYGEAKPLLAERKRAEARKVLDDTRPKIKGFPAAEKQLDQHLNELK